MTTAFDTLEATHRLEAAGMERMQAEAIAETAREAAIAGQPVTRTELEAALAALKADITIRMYAAVGVGVAVMVALLKFVPNA